MRRYVPVAAVVCLAIITAGSMGRAEIYLFENFEGPHPQIPTCWYGSGKATLTSEKAFSGKYSARIEMGGGHWEIRFPKPLKWDRTDPAGIGNRPLYLSARIYAVSGGEYAPLGLHGSIVPKRHPPTHGVPFMEPALANVAGRTGKWLHLCLDVGQWLRRVDSEGSENPDQYVFEGVSLTGGGTFYVDDVRLSTERPDDCTPQPQPPTLDTAGSCRPDATLEGGVWHGAYGGVGSLLNDFEIHPTVARDVKRHYLNFVYGFQYGAKSPEPILRAVERTLDQAAQYDLLFLPISYIGDTYNLEAQTWGDEKLRDEMLKIVRRFKDKSHLLGWYLEEESGIGDNAGKLLKQKNWIEEEDRKHRVWNILNLAPPAHYFGPAYTVVCADHYPIQGPNSNPWSTPRAVAGIVAKLKQPFLLTDQIFAGGCGWTVPTLGQWRLMAYGALAEGVKGFFHFLYCNDLLYRVPAGERLYGSMVDAYGTPSPIYQEIQRHLGPDLFSIGELLRTCHPDPVPSEIRVSCGTVEDSRERTIPAIALRRLTDRTGGYEVIALYSDDPDKVQTGTLRLPASWLGGRMVMDLSAHSRDILRDAPIVVASEQTPLRLESGDGQFFVIVKPTAPRALVRRMQTRRFEAIRKMVEFDCRWLAQVGVGKPYAAKEWKDLQDVCDRGSPSEALRRAMQIDDANQQLMRTAALGAVLRQLDVSRQRLTAACKDIETWSVPAKDKPFPPHVQPGKSYCDVQDKLGELYIGFSDLAYCHRPEALVAPTAALERLCAEHAAHLRQESPTGVPKKPCQLALERLKPLEKQLSDLGWRRPPTRSEIK